MNERVAADLWLWKEAAQFTNPQDWIFASPRKGGKESYWPGTVLAKIVQPTARRAGTQKKVGWHTFRHTYSTLLVANGENLKVVQELMRYARGLYHLDLCTQARLIAKRRAQQRVVECLFNDAPLPTTTMILGSNKAQHLAWNEHVSGC
jgi:integrase